jgi:uncharacterized membrane protein
MFFGVISFFAYKFHDEYITLSIRSGSILNIVFWILTLLGMRTTYTYKGVYTLVSISILGMMIETIGVTTCVPYGCFSYTQRMGILIADMIPIMLFFSRSPILIGACAILQKTSIQWSLIVKVCVSVLVLLLFDVVFDPGAVILKIRNYDHPGWYYGVPRSNFGGRILSGLVGCMIYRSRWRWKSWQNISPLLIIPFIWWLFFWTGIALRSHMFIPFIIGMILIGAIYHALDKNGKIQ